MMTNSRAQQLTGLNAMSAATSGGKVKLFKNNFSPTPDSVAGDFTECDFSGYAPINMSAFGTAYIDSISGQYVADSVAKTFLATSASPFVANTVYGYFITDGTGLNLLGFEKFATPIPVAVPAAGVSADIVAQIGNQ